MFTSPIGFFSGAERNTDDLSSVISSACCDIDATIAASYGGSGQTWSNLVASPADSSSQADYNFFLGADGGSSTDDPSFTGSVGDIAAYFDLDGGDFFTITDETIALIKGLHKTSGGSAWWIGIAYQHAGSGSDAAWSQLASISEGCEVIVISGTDSPRVNFDRGASRSLNNMSIGAPGDGTDYLLLLSFDPITDDITVWRNTTTGVTDTDASPDTSTADASGRMTIASRPPGGGGNTLLADTRVYGFYIGNEYLDDTKAGTIFTHIRDRHARDYTP